MSLKPRRYFMKLQEIVHSPIQIYDPCLDVRDRPFFKFKIFKRMEEYYSIASSRKKGLKSTPF